MKNGLFGVSVIKIAVALNSTCNNVKPASIGSLLYEDINYLGYIS
jgi:hypothetical protein